MKEFPLIPLGEIIICKKKTADVSSIVIPEGTAKEMEYIVGEVISCGTGRYSEAGHLIPFGIEVGDEVAFPAREAAKITYSLRVHLRARGIADADMDDMMVLHAQMVVAKFRKVSPEAQQAIKEGNTTPIL